MRVKRRSMALRLPLPPHPAPSDRYPQLDCARRGPPESPPPVRRKVLLLPMRTQAAPPSETSKGPRSPHHYYRLYEGYNRDFMIWLQNNCQLRRSRPPSRERKQLVLGPCCRSVIAGQDRIATYAK